MPCVHIFFVFFEHCETRFARSLAYGSEHGLVIVDYVQKICLLNVASPDLYGAQDPYSRAPRSPKSRLESATYRDEQTRSPSIDQVMRSIQSLQIQREENAVPHIHRHSSKYFEKQ